MRVTRGGFSLLEMLIVVGILAVVGALALPPLARAVATSRPAYGAAALESALREAQTIAARRGEPVTLLAQLDADADWVLAWIPGAAEQVDGTGAPGENEASEPEVVGSLPRGWSVLDLAESQAEPEALLPTSVELAAVNPGGLASLRTGWQLVAPDASVFDPMLDPLTLRATLEAATRQSLDSLTEPMPEAGDDLLSEFDSAPEVTP